MLNFFLAFFLANTGLGFRLNQEKNTLKVVETENYYIVFNAERDTSGPCDVTKDARYANPNWDDAENYCKVKYGTGLGEVNTKELQTEIDNVYATNTGYYALWVGLRRNSQGKLVWRDGTDLLDSSLWTTKAYDHNGECVMYYGKNNVINVGYHGLARWSCNEQSANFLCTKRNDLRTSVTGTKYKLASKSDSRQGYFVTGNGNSMTIINNKNQANIIEIVDALNGNPNAVSFKVGDNRFMNFNKYTGHIDNKIRPNGNSEFDKFSSFFIEKGWYPNELTITDFWAPWNYIAYIGSNNILYTPTVSNSNINTAKKDITRWIFEIMPEKCPEVDKNIIRKDIFIDGSSQGFSFKKENGKIRLERQIPYPCNECFIQQIFIKEQLLKFKTGTIEAEFGTIYNSNGWATQFLLFGITNTGNNGEQYSGYAIGVANQYKPCIMIYRIENGQYTAMVARHDKPLNVPINKDKWLITVQIYDNKFTVFYDLTNIGTYNYPAKEGTIGFRSYKSALKVTRLSICTGYLDIQACPSTTNQIDRSIFYDGTDQKWSINNGILTRDTGYPCNECFSQQIFIRQESLSFKTGEITAEFGTIYNGNGWATQHLLFGITNADNNGDKYTGYSVSVANQYKPNIMIAKIDNGVYTDIVARNTKPLHNDINRPKWKITVKISLNSFTVYYDTTLIGTYNYPAKLGTVGFRTFKSGGKVTSLTICNSDGSSAKSILGDNFEDATDMAANNIEDNYIDNNDIETNNIAENIKTNSFKNNLMENDNFKWMIIGLGIGTIITLFVIFTFGSVYCCLKKQAKQQKYSQVVYSSSSEDDTNII